MGCVTPCSLVSCVCQVLYLYSAIDDFMMNNLHEFSGRKLVTAEVSDVAADTKPAEAEKGQCHWWRAEGGLGGPRTAAVHCSIVGCCAVVIVLLVVLPGRQKRRRRPQTRRR